MRAALFMEDNMAIPSEEAFLNKIWDDLIDHVNNYFLVQVQGGLITLAGPVVVSEIMGALPAGDNNIGNVDLASPLPAGTNNIGDVDLASEIPAGDEHIGQVGSTRTEIAITPTITAGAYTAGDALGGRLDFANAVREAGGSGIIEKVVIVDDADQQASVDLVLFDQAFTATGDNNPFDPTDADLENCIGHIPVTAGEYASFNDNAVATKRNVGLAIVLDAAETTLYGQLVVRDAPTYAAITDITVKVTIRQD